MIKSILAWALALASCRSETPPAVAVYAAASLKDVATEIAAEWSKRSGRPVSIQANASSTLARQIQEGAPADLFLSAAPEWLDRLGPRERRDWLTNRLVLVVRKEEKDVDPKRLDSLALANERVPAGKYARQAFETLGFPIPARVIGGQNVRDVLSKVSEGGARAGVVYATDAALDPKVRIAFEFPPESHARVVYSVGLLRPAGRELFDFLRDPWSLEAARRHGFGLP